MTTAFLRTRIVFRVAVSIAAGVVLSACGSGSDQAQAAAPADAGQSAIAAPAEAAHSAGPTADAHGVPIDPLSELLKRADDPNAVSSGPKEDIDAIRKVIMDHYADPGCEELTDNAERQFGYGPGPECDRIIDERNHPRKVKVGAVHVHGDDATAEVEGDTFLMVRRDYKWLIDGVR